MEDLNQSVIEFNGNSTQEVADHITELFTNEQIIQKQKEEEERIYGQHKISAKDYIARKKKWDEIKDTYGEDPYFNQIFGSFDPILSLQFVSEEELPKVLEEYTEKEITKIHVEGRNSTHARLLRKLKNRELEKKKTEDKKN